MQSVVASNTSAFSTEADQISRAPSEATAGDKSAKRTAISSFFKRTKPKSTATAADVTTKTAKSAPHRSFWRGRDKSKATHKTTEKSGTTRGKEKGFKRFWKDKSKATSAAASTVASTPAAPTVASVQDLSRKPLPPLPPRDVPETVPPSTAAASTRDLTTQSANKQSTFKASSMVPSAVKDLWKTTKAATTRKTSPEKSNTENRSGRVSKLWKAMSPSRNNDRSTRTAQTDGGASAKNKKSFWNSAQSTFNIKSNKGTQTDLSDMGTENRSSKWSEKYDSFKNSARDAVAIGRGLAKKPFKRTTHSKRDTEEPVSTREPVTTREGESRPKPSEQLGDIDSSPERKRGKQSKASAWAEGLSHLAKSLVRKGEPYVESTTINTSRPPESEVAPHFGPRQSQLWSPSEYDLGVVARRLELMQDTVSNAAADETVSNERSVRQPTRQSWGQSIKQAAKNHLPGASRVSNWFRSKSSKASPDPPADSATRTEFDYGPWRSRRALGSQQASDSQVDVSAPPSLNEAPVDDAPQAPTRTARVRTSAGTILDDILEDPVEEVDADTIPTTPVRDGWPLRPGKSTVEAEHTRDVDEPWNEDARRYVEEEIDSPTSKRSKGWLSWAKRSKAPESTLQPIGKRWYQRPTEKAKQAASVVETQYSDYPFFDDQTPGDLSAITEWEQQHVVDDEEAEYAEKMTQRELGQKPRRGLKVNRLDTEATDLDLARHLARAQMNHEPRGSEDDLREYLTEAQSQASRLQFFNELWNSTVPAEYYGQTDSTRGSSSAAA